VAVAATTALDYCPVYLTLIALTNIKAFPVFESKVTLITSYAQRRSNESVNKLDARTCSVAVSVSNKLFH